MTSNLVGAGVGSRRDSVQRRTKISGSTIVDRLLDDKWILQWKKSNVWQIQACPEGFRKWNQIRLKWSFQNNKRRSIERTAAISRPLPAGGWGRGSLCTDGGGGSYRPHQHHSPRRIQIPHSCKLHKGCLLLALTCASRERRERKGMMREHRLSTETGIPFGEDFLGKESLFILPLSFRPYSNQTPSMSCINPHL